MNEHSDAVPLWRHKMRPRPEPFRRANCPEQSFVSLRFYGAGVSYVMAVMENSNGG
jgi:hypothetical protein